MYETRNSRTRVCVLKKFFKTCLFVFFILFSNISVVDACTIFTVTDQETIFFGNNEDYTNPNTYYWVDPPKNGGYGGVYFGFGNFWPQGGMNEKGLAFDINGLDPTPINPHPELPSFTNYEGYVILRNCASVEEAIELVKNFDWGNSMGGQIHLADASGDAVVIGPGLNGELAFTRKQVGESFLISTNFNVASGRREGLCRRYDKAAEILEVVGKDVDLSLGVMVEVLDAVHMEGAFSNTLYSNVYDLKNGEVYVYYFHQFDEVVKLNVEEEITHNRERILLSTMFSDSVVERAYNEHSWYVLSIRILVILGVVFLSGFIFLILRRARDIFFQ